MMFNNILFFILFVNFTICSSTLLWRIETSPPSYIFGSIHVPYSLVWPYVSNETREAFQSSTHFYAEIDAKSDAYWDDFLQCLVNRSKRTRRSNQSVYEGDLLDVYLTAEARRLNKTVGSLEAPESHCKREGWRFNLTTWKNILDRVKKEMRNGTLSLKEIKDYFKKSTVKKYICDEITGAYLQTLYMSKKDVQQVEERDQQMSKYIHSLLKHSKNDRYFFVVGAAHMIGKHRNLKVRLNKFGYNITRICTDRKSIKKKYGCKKKATSKHCLKKTDD